MGYPWVISAVVTAITLFIVLRSEKVNPFLVEVVAELREVTWPTWQEVVSHTRVVILTVIVIALILGAFDVLWAKMSKFLLNPTL
ncbi:MAG: preprotein translocase subunit SecE [Gammaproteobacteria bacterium]|nr:MAG: preprotein translocase subunit SecE [Gammaproteobacteria bacterium]